MTAGFRSPFMPWSAGISSPVPPATQAGFTSAFFWLAGGINVGSGAGGPPPVDLSEYLYFCRHKGRR